MKVAEALLERSSLGRKIQELTDRAEASARYQEGEDAPEDMPALLEQTRAALDRLEHLIASINRTNAATFLDENVTITDAIANRDVLKMRHSFLRGTADALAGNSRRSVLFRAARSELRFVMAMPPAEVRQQADDAAKAIRELDARIQEASWKTDLIE